MKRMSLREKVFAFTSEKNLFSAPCHVLLGLSGGADSMALLDVLCHWPLDGLKVSAVHIHHGLRGESADRDEQFVRNVCNANGISLIVKRVDVPAIVVREHSSVEDAARRLRYSAMEEARLECGADYIVTAHTVSDQAETVLMRAVRGCGIDGLIGIHPMRGVVRRPLLSCDRETVETYCAAQHIDYVYDETNSDTRYTRNFIRHELMPKLKQLNPSVEEALFRLADHAQDEVAYLDVEAEQAMQRENGSLVSLAPVIRRRCIRKRLFVAGVPSVEEKHILAVEKEVIHENGRVDLPGDFTAYVHKGKLSVLQKDHSPHFAETIGIISFPSEIIFGEYLMTVELTEINEGSFAKNVHKLFFNNQIDYDKIQGGLYLRTRRTGDRIRPIGRGVSKSIKKLMNELEIPPHLRDTYPLLCDEKGILMIPNYTCDERVGVTKDTRHFLVCKTIKG